MSPEEDRARDAVDSEPKHYQLSYSGPECLLTLTVLHHTIPHKLCRSEMKGMHSVQCFSSTDSDGSERKLFILCLTQEIFF